MILAPSTRSGALGNEPSIGSITDITQAWTPGRFDQTFASIGSAEEDTTGYSR